MRLEGWEERLAEVIERHSRAPFEWGVSDCCVMPMDVCGALIGTVPPAFANAKYHDVGSAVRLLRSHRWQHLGDFFAAAFDEIPPAFAHRGDIGLAEYPGAILGGGVVVLGAEVLGKGELGTVRVPRETMHRAFRIE